MHSAVSDCHSYHSPSQTLRLGATPGVMDKLFCLRITKLSLLRLLPIPLRQPFSPYNPRDHDSYNIGSSHRLLRDAKLEESVLNRQRKCFPAQAAVGDKGHKKKQAPGMSGRQRALKSDQDAQKNPLRPSPKKNFGPSVFLPLFFTLSISRLSSFQD